MPHDMTGGKLNRLTWKKRCGETGENSVNYFVSEILGIEVSLRQQSMVQKHRSSCIGPYILIFLKNQLCSKELLLPNFVKEIPARRIDYQNLHTLASEINNAFSSSSRI